jgi:DNA-binding NarL/FixJ family response regulator
MEAFAQRAESELRATGEKSRARTDETRFDLTPQELRIAELVAEGDTNKEIAAQMYISTATVEYHLHKMFRKLGVKTRTQLVQRLHQLNPRAE